MPVGLTRKCPCLCFQVLVLLLYLVLKNELKVFHCLSIVEDTVEIQERVENSLKSLLEQLKGKCSNCGFPYRI